MKPTAWVCAIVLPVLLLFGTLAGCEQFDKVMYDANGQPSQTMQTIDGVASGVAGAAATQTGGLSLLIYAIASTVIGAGASINRAMLAHQRAKALREIDKEPNTPPATSMVKTPALKKVVESAVAG